MMYQIKRKIMLLKR
uniref:Uncharacterized protein n=1 Tax=Arundo donax TaxID=35708 RepID=A0A0A9GUA1_ARUDO